MSLWLEKLRAFAIHFLVTAAVATVAAGLIFLIWFPAPFAKMVSGTKLFLLVSGCDLALGPLVSLVIYNSRKSTRALLIDYTIVGLVQLAAFIYGIYAVSLARPVYVTFVKDRLEVITAREIAVADLAEARSPEFRTLPHYGPVLIGTQVKSEEHNDALEGALDGRDIAMRPKFFVPYAAVRQEVIARAHAAESLTQQHPESAALLQTALDKLGRTPEQVRWLPAKHAGGFWTALLDPASGEPVAYVALDPY